MGLFSRILGGGMRDPVRGSAQVTACSGYHEGTYASCHMQLVVQADGVPATAVEFEGLVHHRRWPSPGMMLPVTVDRADPQNVKIEWDEVPDSRDRSRESAEAMAAALRGEGGAAGLAGMGGVNVINLSGGDLSQLSEEQRAKLRMLGIDPAALAGGAQAPTAPEEDPVDDQLARLERLGALRAQGILSEDEFQVQKRRILESG